MPLEKAGISLVAENFNKYISQLNKIQKAQSNAFNVDSRGLESSFGKAEKASGKFGASLQSQAGKGSKAFTALGVAASTGLGIIVAAGAAAATAIGALTAATVNLANQTDQATKKIASSLGITATEAADKYGEALNNIFINNPEAQFEDIAQAIALTERALDLDATGIEQVAGDALKISQVFEQDLQKTIGANQQLIEQFGLTGQQATDLITKGLQTIPAEDLIDTVNEYSNQFAQAGFSADEFFSILETGTAGGVLGTDRIADATKEFQIRFLEGNEGLKNGLSTLGLSYDQLAQQVDNGQASIADVFGVVVGRTKEVDLSIAGNRAAIAGLGTQFEDLGAVAVAGLNTTGEGFSNVAGAANSLDERFSTLSGTLTSVGRAALIELQPIGQAIIELANSAIPQIRAGFEAIRPTIEAFAARIVPAIEFSGEAFGRLTQSLGVATNGAGAFESVMNGLASVIEGLAGGIEILARTAETFRQIITFAKAGAAAFGSVIGDVFNAFVESFGLIGRAFQQFIQGDFKGALQSLSTEVLNFDDTFDKAGQAAIEKFKEAAIREAADTEPLQSPIALSDPIGGGASGAGVPSGASDNIKEADDNLKAYQATLKQAENLQLSFARAAEDTALRLARANEDIARKQGKQVAKLEESQAKDRDKLLKDQVKRLDDFESSRREQIAKAESDIAKERKAANDQRKRDQQKLQRELQQAQEKFNLSRLQSERRFSLQDRRLRAEGDILALQELRENRDLERQEETENFGQAQKERKQSAEEQQKEQAQDLQNRVNELKANLENQRAELLASFDEQLAAQQAAQQEAKLAQQQAFREQGEERAIQLQREEEDRRISQGRQLEDLGRSFAEQEGVTAEGTAAIANQLESVFGIDGTADNIISGFAAKTKNEFTTLFDELEEIVKNADMEIEAQRERVTTNLRSGTGGGFGGRLGGVQEFHEGGVVAGPIGSPQIASVLGGETVLPTHQQNFTMNAPVIPSQNLNVNMSGGFNISGGEAAGEQATRQAIIEMTDAFEVVVKRLGRQV